jgi:hypothetical protein
MLILIVYTSVGTLIFMCSCVCLLECWSLCVGLFVSGNAYLYEFVFVSGNAYILGFVFGKYVSVCLSVTFMCSSVCLCVCQKSSVWERLYLCVNMYVCWKTYLYLFNCMSVGILIFMCWYVCL